MTNFAKFPHPSASEIARILPHLEDAQLPAHAQVLGLRLYCWVGGGTPDVLVASTDRIATLRIGRNIEVQHPVRTDMIGAPDGPWVEVEWADADVETPSPTLRSLIYYAAE